MSARRAVRGQLLVMVALGVILAECHWSGLEPGDVTGRDGRCGHLATVGNMRDFS